MKRHIWLVTVIVSMVSVATSAPAMPADETQLGMQSRACAEFADEQREMEVVYSRVVARLAGRKGSLRRLEAAQAAWRRYRDAHLNFLYPPNAPGLGSTSRMCRCMEAGKMTETRAAELRKLLEPEEGDVCLGVTAR